ncbi:MAG: restriction modification system specificity domain protein [Alphaproteobacteria bacterium]|jgi:type I restriction enzyme S subunit|nr:restriction modification system specificity domain protein [Alphaproteobacteria bacterium]MDF3033925.1 restriction modification system specificity domain protein [Alphaproteobacteria bacterium]
MSSEWVQTKLSDLGTFDRGKSKHRPRDATHLYGGSYPFIQTGDITASGGRIISYRQTYSEAGLAQSKLWPEGTLCITIAANIAETALLTFPACFPDSVVGFLPYTGKSDVRFIEYMFRSFRGDIKSRAYGSVQENINLEVLRSLVFPVPNLKTQITIADFLSLFDDRIENLREINTTLETIAQALFKSWFVDFDPVRAKSEGRQPEGMNAETAALFPDSFEEAEMGLIPKGWKFSTVDQSFILTMGQSPPGETYNENGVGLPFYQGRTDFGFRFPSKRIYCCSPVRLAEKDDILVSVRAPVGDVNVALEKCCLGRGVAGVRHSDGYKSFALYSIQNLGFHFKIFESGGTVFGSINKKDFQGLPIIASPAPVMQAFDKLVMPLDGRIQINEEQIRILSKIRDSLLPKLISGEIRIHDAEKPLEVVV